MELPQILLCALKQCTNVVRLSKEKSSQLLSANLVCQSIVSLWIRYGIESTYGEEMILMKENTERNQSVKVVDLIFVPQVCRMSFRHFYFIRILYIVYKVIDVF